MSRKPSATQSRQNVPWAMMADNPGSIEVEIRRSLLPRYYKFFGGLDKANTLIDKIITIVRAGSARGKL